MIVAGTGHRPDKITMGGRNAYDAAVHARLVELAVAVLKQPRPKVVISGMALGWDTALADAAVELDIDLWAYIPFIGQEKRWPEASQAHYTRLLTLAEKVVVCSEGGYAAWKMQVRNKRMVDDCDRLLALWNGSDGGTANCVRYARERGRKIVNLWPSWMKYSAL